VEWSSTSHSSVFIPLGLPAVWFVCVPGIRRRLFWVCLSETAEPKQFVRRKWSLLPYSRAVRWVAHTKHLAFSKTTRERNHVIDMEGCGRFTPSILSLTPSPPSPIVLNQSATTGDKMDNDHTTLAAVESKYRLPAWPRESTY
jgi:hypothetical protein